MNAFLGTSLSCRTSTHPPEGACDTPDREPLKAIPVANGMSHTIPWHHLICIFLTCIIAQLSLLITNDWYKALWWAESLFSCGQKWVDGSAESREWYGWVQEKQNPLHFNLEVDFSFLGGSKTRFCNIILDSTKSAHTHHLAFFSYCMLSSKSSFCLSFVFYLCLSCWHFAAYCWIPMDTTSSWGDKDIMNHQQSLPVNELRRCVVLILCGAWTLSRRHYRCDGFLSVLRVTTSLNWNLADNALKLWKTLK